MALRQRSAPALDLNQKRRQEGGAVFCAEGWMQQRPAGAKARAPRKKEDDR